MLTLTEAESRYGVRHLDHLDKDAAVPTVSRLAAQGDVLIVRDDKATPATTAIPTEGFPAVRGESGGNTHLLVGAGFYDPISTSRTGLEIGRLTVPDGQEVLLSHPEHGGLLIQPGSYTLRRQREQSDEIRLVSD